MNQGQLADKEKELEKTINQMSEDGAKNLHILTDFDKTLTDPGEINGKKISSTISQIRAGGYLGEEYSKLSYELFDKYSPLEHDQSISKEERSQKMAEWYSLHHKILVKYGLNKAILDDIMEKSHSHLKNGVADFIISTNKKQIPIIIMSAGPAYMIQKQLELENLMLDNVHIVANFYEFDKDGYMTGTLGQLIHSANKYETAVKNFDFYNKIRERTNVIQIGDVIDDIGMAQGFEYKNLLSIGFCYKEQNRAEFEKVFDLVLDGADGFEKINKIIDRIV